MTEMLVDPEVHHQQLVLKFDLDLFKNELRYLKMIKE